jgi:hypothetical protein
MVLTAYFVLSPVTGLFCHRHFRGNCLRENLAPASGARTTRLRRPRERRSLATPPRPPHPTSTFVTTRTPLCSRRDEYTISDFPKVKYLCVERTDNPNQLESPQQISIYADAIWQRKSPVSESIVRKIEQILPVGRISLQPDGQIRL